MAFFTKPSRPPSRATRLSRADRWAAHLALRTASVEKVFETASRPHSYVLRRISCGDIQPGEFVSRPWDPRSAGTESTLLAILGMLDSAWAGEFYFVGTSGARDEPQAARGAEQRTHRLRLSSSTTLIDDLTVAENLDIPLSYRNVKKSEREAIVADTLDNFGMVGKKDLYPRQLSGGQQQLVGVARAVIAKPKLILADELDGQLALEPGPRDHGAIHEVE